MLGRFAYRAVTASLVALAAPAVGQAEPPPLEAYGELPALEDIAISTSGKLAMLTTSGGKRVLVMLDEALKPTSAVEVGDIKVRDIDWVGDEAVMVERSDTQDLGERFIARNNEFFNAMIVPVDGEDAVRTIFMDDRSILNAVFGTYGFRESDGGWRGYFAGIPMAMGQAGQYYFNGGGAALYAVDMESNDARRITSPFSGEERGDWLIDIDGDVVATLTFWDNSGKWRIANDRGGEIASGATPKGHASLLALGRDGSTAVYQIADEDGNETYFEVPLAGDAAPSEIWPDEEIAEIFHNPSTGRLIGYRPDLEGEEGDPVFFDPRAEATVGKVMTSFRRVGGTIRGLTPDFGRVLLTTAGNNDSGTWYLIDTAAGQAHVIGRSRPGISPYQVGPISTVSYTARDGLEIEGILTLPPGREAKNLPVVIFPHGGPRAHDEETFDWWAQAFASRGYAVLQPNFRGSTGYGTDFMNAGNGEWGKKMQTDMSDGLAYLAGQGIVDPERACIMGASYGGYAALAGVTLQQDIYRCSVAVAGVSDLRVFLNREYNESGSRELREGWLEMMGPRDELDAVSPRRFATNVDVPVLLIHGRDDTVVPYEQSTLMADALKDAGKPYELVDLREEDHWLSRSETRKKMLEAAMAFVQKHNPAN